MNIFQATIGGGNQSPLLVIINGESNSGGYALNSEALSAELLPRDSVLILDNTGLASFDVLDIGTNNLVGHSGLSNGPTHGFELELANRADVLNFYKKPVHLIKTGQGGSTIAQWLPGSGSGFFEAFEVRIDAAKLLIDFDAHKKVILFSLGINDAISGTNVATWKAATIAHIERMRDEIGDDTPIIMTEFQGMGSGGTQYATYNTAIQEIAAADPNAYSVDVTGAGLRDVNHWNYAGMKLVTGRMLDIAQGLNY